MSANILLAMFEEKLSEIFSAPGVDPDELCQLLLHHFGSGHGEGVKTLVFSRSNEPALKLTFNRAGLAQIISCPGPCASALPPAQSIFGTQSHYRERTGAPWRSYCAEVRNSQAIGQGGHSWGPL